MMTRLPSSSSAHLTQRSWVDRHRRIITLWLFPVIIASLLLVVYEGMALANAIRAYIAGESLWSKGQKDAVQHLYRFATTHDDAEYQRYRNALSVPLADRQARLILQRPNPDIDQAAHWFVLARNDKADARNMAVLFLRFKWVSYMRRAIEIWTDGDRDIDAMQQLAQQLRGMVRARIQDPIQYRAVIDRIAYVNEHLTQLEADFSATLGAGARWMSRVMFTVVIVVGVILMWIGTAITNRLLHHARTTAELERRHAEEFRALVEHAPDVIVRFDRDLRYTYVNPTVTLVTGLPTDVFLGKRLDELGFPPHLTILWQEMMQKVLTTGEDREISFEFPSVLGIRNFHARFTPERAQDGSIESVLCIGRDVSDLKASEQALRDSEAQLRQAQKMEAIGRLAGGVAHDFNNLLTVIGASLDMALQDMSTTTQFSTNLLLDARRAAERAEELTRQLLAFSRQQIIQPRALRLDAAVTDMQSMLARLIGEDINLVTTFDPATPAIQADPGQIGQVVLNLAVNAREAMPSGGTLTIRTSTQEPPEGPPTTIGATEGLTSSTWAVLEVCDTGIGMDDAVRTRIFEPFFTTRGEGHGVGLGLSVVYGIVSQSGGHIEVHSDVGRGTTFRISFPGCEAPEAAPVQRRSSTREPGNETILVAEDEISVRSLVREMLIKQGYTVVEAANGEEALSWMEREGDSKEIDLIISDVVMPFMGGRELVRELSRRGFEVPVLFMSGYTNDPTPLENMLGGAAPFLPKPFTIDQLYDIVRQTLDTSARVKAVVASEGYS